MTEFPIDAILPDLSKALERQPNAVLQAEPGAGKTTRVPLALLDSPWRNNGKILMLEPRRLAARAAARFMARTLGEQVGERVGYRIQLDSQVGPKTVIEVVTEGVLTRILQRDPALEGIACVIFDEFHERSLQGDLGLALCLDTQAGLRDDLRLLVMSATLDVEPVAALMGNAPILASKGRTYPVEIRYLGPPDKTRGQPLGDAFCSAVASAVRQALREDEGSLLVFLPGEGEIRRVERRLSEAELPADVRLAPLYGALSQTQQDQAITPALNDERKVVLATAIAETSLTIEGIRVVIDGGQARLPRFDPASGMSRLVTETVSLAAATQRQGRAGRLGPGICYRLWDKASEGGMQAFNPAEITEADLAPLALDLANWGVLDPMVLNWLTPPPTAALAQARDLLKLLGGLDEKDRITPHGRAMANLPMHPRLAHMVVRGTSMGWGETACRLAALLSERDPARRTTPLAPSADITLRVAAMTGEQTSLAIDKRALGRIKALAKQWISRLKRNEANNVPSANSDDDIIGALIAFAYPDRIAQRRPGGEPRYRMRNAKGAQLMPEDTLRDAPYLAVAEVAGERREARIRLAAPLSEQVLDDLFSDAMIEDEFAVWDSRSGEVKARRQKRLGALVLSDAPAKFIPPEQITGALLEGVREVGLDCLPWTKEAINWRNRVQCLYLTTGDGVDMSDAALLERLEDWLAPYLAGKSRLAHLKSLDLLAIVKAMLDWDAQQRLDASVPSHFQVPSGSHIRIDYTDPRAPVLPVKLQEMFGATETPTVIDGRLPLTMHLLSPAGRPLQITQDLPAFWAGGYAHVKAEMRGRYPKHPWPDDPVTAEPTRYTKNRAKPR